MAHRPLDGRDGSELCRVSLIVISQSQLKALTLNSGREVAKPDLGYHNIISNVSLHCTAEVYRRTCETELFSVICQG